MKHKITCQETLGTFGNTLLGKTHQNKISLDSEYLIREQRYSFLLYFRVFTELLLEIKNAELSRNLENSCKILEF
jgi:hypothetical protein